MRYLCLTLLAVLVGGCYQSLFEPDGCSYCYKYISNESGELIVKEVKTGLFLTSDVERACLSNHIDLIRSDITDEYSCEVKCDSAEKSNITIAKESNELLMIRFRDGKSDTLYIPIELE